ncbi:MAG: helix-turn-helix domain-containing protein, partial [Clostridia bacterium]|nr:helix-turn-helix domain-containing protein [Clostridia bacterium]
MKRKGTKDLTLTQRRKIENWLAIGATKKQIAEQLGVCLATVYNELKRGQCTQKIYTYTDYWGERHYKQVTAYSADIAEYKYRQNQSAHGAPLKIDNDFELVREIENRVINDKISPCAALGRIKREKACRTMISKTTLYRYIRAGYIFTRITMNDVQLKQRHYQKATIKRPPKGTSIEKRPAEVDARK